MTDYYFWLGREAEDAAATIEIRVPAFYVLDACGRVTHTYNPNESQQEETE